MTIRAKRRIRGQNSSPIHFNSAFQRNINHILQTGLSLKKSRAATKKHKYKFKEKVLFGNPVPDHSGMAIISVPGEKVIMINNPIIKILGTNEKDIVGRKLSEFSSLLFDEDIVFIRNLIKKQVNIKNLKIGFQTFSGDIKSALLSWDFIFYNQKEYLRIQLEELPEIQKLHNDFLCSIEQVRQQIGCDLHDTLGQDLTGISFLVQALKQEIKEKGKPDELLQISKIEELIKKSIKNTRNLSRMLIPPDLKNKNIVSLLSEMCVQVEDIFIISCNLHTDGNIRIKNDQAAKQIYYIAKEAVNNALKHGSADVINIYLKTDGNNLLMTIRDNGNRIEETSDGDGIGLRNMNYRAGLINASVEYIFEKNSGFTVLIIARNIIV